jgi:hypothetical protein
MIRAMYMSVRAMNMSVRQPMVRQSAIGDDTYGNLSSGLIWDFKEVTAGDMPFTNNKTLYEGETKLRSGIGDSWSTPFESFQAMGCNRGFVALLAQHSDDYAKN